MILTSLNIQILGDSIFWFIFTFEESEDESDYKNTDDPTTVTPRIANPHPIKCLLYNLILISSLANKAVQTIDIPANIIQVELYIKHKAI